MRNSMLSIPALLGAVVAVAAVITNTAGADPASPAESAAPEQDLVKLEAGTWDALVEFPPASPDAKPTYARGVQTNTLVPGGRWIRNDFEVEPAYVGHGTWGWDPRRQRYVGIWVDSNTDYIRHDEGRYDAATRTLTWESELRQPEPHPPAKFKLVEEFRDDTRVLTMTAIGPKTGKAVPLGKITFTRRAAAGTSGGSLPG